MREFQAADKKIYREIQEATERVAELAAQQKLLPLRVPLAEARPDQDLMKLSTERKHLTNVLKLVAYQIESDLVLLLRPHYARAEDEGRTLIPDRPAINSHPRTDGSRTARHPISPQFSPSIPGRGGPVRGPQHSGDPFSRDGSSHAIRSRGLSPVIEPDKFR